MTDCIIWEKARSAAGYGQTFVDGRVVYVHRLAYEQSHGVIPDGTEIDHLCRNRACYNVLHLEAVSHRENVLRGASPAAENARRARCALGHEYVLESSGKRRCRECKNAARRTGRALPETCANGHPFAGENLVLRSDGGRACRICRREANRRYEAKRAVR